MVEILLSDKSHDIRWSHFLDIYEKVHFAVNIFKLIDLWTTEASYLFNYGN